MNKTPQSSGEIGAFSARTVIALLVAGVFAFSALVVLSAYAPDLRGGSEGGGHALSNSAEGFAGMAQLLKAVGDPVVISRDARARTASTGLLILTPDTDVKPEDLAALTNAGPTLLVLPKWEAAPQPSHPGWTVKLGAIPPTEVLTMLSRRFTPLAIDRDTRNAPITLSGLPGGDVQTGPIDQFQAIAAKELIPIVSAPNLPHGAAVLSRTANSQLYVLSDPDLMNTQGLKDLANARVGVAIVQMLRKGDGPIVFDVTLNGFKRSRNLLKLALEPPFLGATVCLLAAALLMALQALTRFGAPRRAGRAIALGKLALADNSAALIRLARREPRMAGRYLDLTRAAVAKALGAGRLSESELNALLDRQAGRTGSAYRLTALSAEAAAVADRADLMRLARDLHQWKTEMIGERR